ncbi:hypothetical protein [Myoviridae environmental samples]|nr:hypothetical protein [Myoviridae environmental samples]
MSKNDMVMVPRELAQLIVNGGYCWRKSVERLEAILANQHQGDPVALPARLPTHRINSNGWNACLDEIANLGTLYSWPVQGEPVAFVRFRNGEPDYDGDACMIMNVPGDTLGDGDSWESVYTHPDTRMAGYALTIRELNKEHADEVCDLRTQLAKAHALLRECQPCLEKAGYGTWQIDDLLSASAEPSAMAERIKSAACPECASKPCMCAELIAPAVIDERAEFEAWGTDRGYFNLKREHSGKYKFHTAWAAWEGWQARAALERKPS